MIKEGGIPKSKHKIKNDFVKKQKFMMMTRNRRGMEFIPEWGERGKV